MNNKIKIMVLLAFLSLLITVFYYNYFHVKNDYDSITENLQKEFNKIYNNQSIILLNVTDESTTRYHVAFFKNEENVMGYALMTKGWNFRYKIHSVEFGFKNDAVVYKVHEINNKKLAVVSVFETNPLLEHVKLQVTDYKTRDLFMLDVHSIEFYATFAELTDEQAASSHLLISDINGEDIELDIYAD